MKTKCLSLCLTLLFHLEMGSSAMTEAYLNAGFGSVLGTAWLDKIHNLGFAGIRQGVQVIDLLRWKAVVRELGEYQELSPIFLFGGGDLSGWTPENFLESTILVARLITQRKYFTGVPVYFELGNEPDLAILEWRNNPSKLNTTYWECYQAVKSINSSIELITGGISNLSEDGLDWLEDFLREPIPGNGIVGFHRYPNGTDIGKPQDGFETRQHEMDRLQSIAQGHRLFCTETGLSNGPHYRPRGFPLCWLNRTVYLTDTEQANALEHEWNFYQPRDVIGMVWYQRGDSAGTNLVDHYGIYDKNNAEKVICNTIRKLLLK